MLVFCLLSVEGSLALDFSIDTCLVSVLAFAVSGVKSFLKVHVGVFRALDCMNVVATLSVFHLGFP